MFAENVISKLKKHKFFSEFFTPQGFSQFKRYLITGFTGFGLEYFLFMLLLKVVFADTIPPFYGFVKNIMITAFGKGLDVYTYQYQFSNSVVYVTIFWFNFLVNRFWSFKSKQKIGKQLIPYLALFVFNLIIINSLMYVMISLIGIPDYIAKVPVMGIIVCWNFIMYKKVIYK
jgi:putative flippase GtrA